jgi:hypothetical protein
MVTDEETGGFFLEENLNKNTKTKTKSDRNPPKTLTVLWLDSSWVY